MNIHIERLSDYDRFNKLKTCIKSLPGRTWDMTTTSWQVPFNRSLFDLGRVHRKLSNEDLSCEAIDRMLLEEEASLQREEAERAAVLRHATLCRAMTALRRAVATHAEEPQKLMDAIGAARLAGVRDSLLEDATAELRRRAAAHLSAMIAAADKMVYGAARMPEQPSSQSVDVRSKLDLLQAAVASARQAGVSEHATMDNVAEAENLAEAAADAVTQLTSLLLFAERDEAQLELGSAVAEARQCRTGRAAFAMPAPAAAALDRLSAAIERFSRAEDAYKADARSEELSSQASLVSYETSEADCELAAAKALEAELLEEVRREEERRQAERAAARAAKEREEREEREKQQQAKALCECNRGREVNHSLGYHVCRVYGDFLCRCGNRWSSGNTYVELGVDQPQECRRCKTATLANRKRDLEGRRDDDDDDDDDRVRGEHKADLCRMCQRLRRLKGPHARCDEGRRRGHRFGDDYF